MLFFSLALFLLPLDFLGQEQMATQQSKEKSGLFADSLAFSSNETYFSAGVKDRIILWKQNNFRKRQFLRINGTTINSLAFALDIKLAAACHDGRIYVFDVSNMTLLYKLEGDGKALNSCVFSSKGDTLIAAGAGAKVIFWDLMEKKITKTISFDKPIIRIALSKSETGLALAMWRQPETAFELMNSRGEVVLYDLIKNTKKKILTPHKSKVTFVEQLPKDRLVTAGYDGRVLLYDLNSGKVEREWNHGSWITSVAIAQKTGRIVSGDVDGTVKIWSFKTGKLLESYEYKEYLVNELAFSPDESSLAISVCNETLSQGALRILRFLSVD
jgi:WD40 repeat protein